MVMDGMASNHPMKRAWMCLGILARFSFSVGLDRGGGVGPDWQ